MAPMASSSDDAAAGDEVALEIMPLIRVYKSGRVERLVGTDTVPASLEATSTGVVSKDVTIDPATGVFVRLYLPAKVGAGDKLPIVIYFHGGGFVAESAASITYHRFLNALAARAGAVAVSVDYRRVPEHPLQAAYDDSWAALAWAVASAEPGGGGGAEPWLVEHGDASRVFLAGDSAGANIAHSVAMRAATAAEGALRPPRAAIRGAVLVHPSFWDASNAMPPEVEEKVLRGWRFKTGDPGARADDPRLCPTSPAAPPLASLPCERVMVAVAAEDFLAPKGRAYYAALLASGWRGEAELVDTPGENHVFHLRSPETEAAAEMMERVAGFIARP